MIELFPQGWEEILYNRHDGTTTVDYYLMADLEGDQVSYPTETVAFGYSSEHDVYFELNEGDALRQLRTRTEVDDYVVATIHAADARYTISLDRLLTLPYRDAWMAFHRKHYYEMYRSPSA